MIGKESNWVKLKDLATGCIMRGDVGRSNSC